MQHDEVERVVAAMEWQMRALGIWSDEAPSAQALASTAPFCYDTLQFDQWLQWVFLPRIRALLEQGSQLPGKSDIAPLAEVWFIEQEMAEEAEELVQLIRDFDRLLSP